MHSCTNAEFFVNLRVYVKTRSEMSQDWKDILQAMRGDAPEQSTEPAPEELNEENVTPSATAGQSGKLNVLIDKKGRKGKVATIIEGFTLPDEEVDRIASELKRKIGTGGSARGGEILLQGDWRDKARELLKAQGFKI